MVTKLEGEGGRRVRLYRPGNLKYFFAASLKLYLKVVEEGFTVGFDLNPVLVHKPPLKVSCPKRI